MTKAEEILWQELRRKKLGVRFLRQFSVDAYVLDFYCPELKLAIEVDGVTHGTDDEIEYDKYREETIMNLDIKFLRFTNAEVYNNIEKVLGRIKNTIS